MLTVAAIHFRKFRRVNSDNLTKDSERHLVVPPPSPYALSKGFRLVDADGEAVSRPPVERPRLDERPYVFGDAPVAEEEIVAPRARHTDEWFLSRSSHRSTASILSRRVSIAILAFLIAAALVAYYVGHHATTPTSASSSGATTTFGVAHSTTTTSTTGPTFPSSFVATSTSGGNARYHIPASKYRVKVTGLLGATWAVFDVGPTSRLEWQGTVARGHYELLTLTGNSRVTIGSTTNATVSVDGRPVIFPTPRPATLLLIFSAPSLTPTG